MRATSTTVVLAAMAVAVGCSGKKPHDWVSVGPGENVPETPTNFTMPSYGNTVALTNAPPPISGGTLLALANGKKLVASDPDRDRIYVVDLATRNVATVPLHANDEPGRSIEDGKGRVHVVLRSSGDIFTLDPSTLESSRASSGCAAPRGIAYDSDQDRILVACDGGEVIAQRVDPIHARLVSGEAPKLVASLGRGIRDVVVTHGPRTNSVRSSTRVFVSRFRTAQILELGPDGSIIEEHRPSNAVIGKPSPDDVAPEATLAWRMIAPTQGGEQPVVVHQFAAFADVAPVTGGYGSPPAAPSDCNPAIAMPAVTTEGTHTLLLPNQAVLPVDVVDTERGFAVVAAGNGHTNVLPQVFVAVEGPCGSGTTYKVHGQAIAIAHTPDDSLIVQSREPAQLENVTTGDIIRLAPESREDTGHAIFHSNSGTGIACASCHGEGGDDGHVWSFVTLGKRRTPSLRGTIAGTAPYHWDGQMKDISMLADDVLTGRMSGPELDDPQKKTLESWLGALPAPTKTGATMVDSTSVALGKKLFESAEIGCSGCHSGPRFTSSATVDVGTGGAFQVPSLIGVGARAPYLHDGCAKTLTDRFGSCGGTMHGNTSNLSQADVGHIVDYLETL